MSRLKLLGKNIKKYREVKGLSQNQLAELVDFSREHIGAIEIGKEFISMRKLFEIADILEISVKNLVDFE